MKEDQMGLIGAGALTSTAYLPAAYEHNDASNQAPKICLLHVC